MFSRRQVLSSFVASGAVVVTGVGARATASGAEYSPEIWLPQLSRTAEVMAEAESTSARYAGDAIQFADFLPGITVLAYQGEHASDKMACVVNRLERLGIPVAKPGLSSDGTTFIVFAARDSNTVRQGLSHAVGKLVAA